MDDAPRFDQLNLVVRDMDATLAFYRMLGVAIPNDMRGWPPGSDARHAEAELPGGARLEFDNVEGAKLWHAGWRSGQTAPLGVIGFSVPSREAVDERYTTLTGAGYRGVQPPYDAFWGARYAIVADPDGTEVGLMSPIDPARKFIPSI